MDMLNTINKIDFILDNIYNREYNIFDGIVEILPDINHIFTEFIELIPQLNSVGMDVRMEIVVEQLNELMIAISNKNFISIFDILGYEIKDTILFYYEILNIMNENKGE